MSLVRFKIYKLRFTTPLHISDQRDDAGCSQRTIHSDTFHAALISCLAKAGKDVPEDGDLGCVISDLFPYYQKAANCEPVYFLPMPLQSTLPRLADPADAKKVKKVQWVDAKLYGRLLHGERLFDENRENINLIKSCYLTKQELPEDINGSTDFVKSEVMRRVKIDDRTGAKPALPYYVDRVSFKDYSGLYFLTDGDTQLLDEALKILEMEGVGTDRNVGYGFFTIDKDENDKTMELELDVPENADCQVALSMLIPESPKQLEQLLASEERVAYDFVRRGGWITTPPHSTLRKNAIYAFLPGSVFSKNNEGANVIGRIVNLKPNIEGIDHPIWRNGKSIMLPLKSVKDE